VTHQVNKLLFEFKCPDEDSAFLLRNSIVDLQEQAIELVDNISSRYAGEDEWIRIDRLEIDLGQFGPDALSSAFSTLFGDRFERSLKEKLSGASPGVRTFSTLRSKLTLLKHFLLTGSLLWWTDSNATDIQQIAGEIMAEEPGVFRRFLYDHRRSSFLWMRMRLQLNDDIKALIISAFDEFQTAESYLLQVATRHFEQAGPANFSLQQIRRWVQDTLFTEALSIIDDPVNLTVLKRTLAKHLPGFSAEHAGISVAPELLKVKPVINEQVETEHLFLEMPGEENENETNGLVYMARNAGIVLLAAFLPDFFDRLGMLENNRFVNKEAAHKAVHLVCYLATGKVREPEFRLLLEKLLCGIPAGEPVPFDVELQEHETNEANQLLQSVLSHWNSLKNTSIEGLRENFLKRDGLVNRKEENWLLRVERKTLDVLLDHIPWGISTIRLPWNHYTIEVEW
jgi:hypothetical protein